MVNKDVLSLSRSRERGRVVKKLLIYLSVLVVLMMIIIGFFYLPFFKIDQVEIEGVKSNKEEEILNKTLDFISNKYFKVIPYDNILVFPSNNLKAELLDIFPYISDVNIKSILFNKIILSAKERSPVGILCNPQNECAFIDQAGFVYKSAPYFSGDLFLKFFTEAKLPKGSSASSTWKLGFQVLPEEDFRELIEFVSLVSSKIKISRITLELEGGYKLRTSLDWDIILNRNNKAQETFDNFKILMESQIREKDMENIEYIDLRFGNKVFYKFRE